jgi:hypothetical protein
VIVKPALAAMLASGLVVPETPKLVFPKPAIIKAENLELSKHMLLGMPLTMGMLAGRDNIAYSHEYLNAGGASWSSPYWRRTSVNFGAADPNRLIVVAGSSYRGSTTSWSLNGTCFIGGVAATINWQRSVAGSSANQLNYIVSAVVPTGTSGAVEMRHSTQGSEADFSIYRLIGYSVTHFSTAQGTTGTASITTVNNGVLIGIGSSNTEETSFTWTGLDEYVDYNAGLARHSSAMRNALTTGGAVTVSGVGASNGANWGVVCFQRI